MKKRNLKKFIVFCIIFLYIVINNFTVTSNAKYESDLKIENYYGYVLPWTNINQEKNGYKYTRKDAFYNLKSWGIDVLENLERNFERDCEKDEDFTLNLGEYVYKKKYNVNECMGGVYKEQVEAFGNAIPLAIKQIEKEELDKKVEEALAKVEAGTYTADDIKFLEEAEKKYKTEFNDSYYQKLNENDLPAENGEVTPANDMAKKIKETTEKIEEVKNIYSLPDKVSSGNDSESLDDMIGDADSFVSKASTDESDSGVISVSSLQKFSNSFYNILLTVGIIVAVLVGMIIGIKFMLGGVEEKADIKEVLIPYVVGCVVVFGAFAIWKIVVTVLSQI